MAKTLTTPINVANNIPNLNLWKVLNVTDNDSDATPNAWVTVQVKGGGGKVYPGPGAVYQLQVFDAQSSLVLSVNAAPQRFDDQIITVPTVIAGAYTTLVGVLWGTAGNKATKMAACEVSMLSLGLVTAAFAGS
jgi:hypothetical protein